MSLSVTLQIHKFDASEDPDAVSLPSVQYLFLSCHRWKPGSCAQFVRIVSARENNAINAKMKKDVVLYVGLGLTRYRGKEFWRNFFTIKLIKQSVSVVVTKKYVFYQYLENKLIIWNGSVYTCVLCSLGYLNHNCCLTVVFLFYRFVGTTVNIKQRENDFKN